MANLFNKALLTVGALGLLGGCAGGPSMPKLGPLVAPTTTATIAAATTVGADEAARDKPAPTLTFAATPTLDQPVQDVYVKIARPLLNCWFGASGPLKGSHIFNAEAPSPSTGGDIDMAVHERDSTQPSPRGTRAYQIHLENLSGARTKLNLRNNKFPGDLAAALEQDVLAWAADKPSCQAQIVRPPPVAAPASAKAKVKKRRG